MNRPLRLSLALVCVACHVTHRIAPVQLWVAHSRADVVSLAAATLTSMGFAVTRSDTSAGRLTATRAAPSDGNFNFIHCDEDSSLRAHYWNRYDNFGSRVDVSLSARDSAGGVTVGVVAEVPIVRSIDQDEPGHTHGHEWTCWSSGRIEQIIAAAIH